MFAYLKSKRLYFILRACVYAMMLVFGCIIAMILSNYCIYHVDMTTIVLQAYCKYTTFLGQGSLVEYLVTDWLNPL